MVAIDLGGRRIAETRRALRVLETSHPPGYCLPLADVARGVLRPGPGGTWCEFKGQATYFDVVSGEVVAQHAGWHNPQPARGYEALVGHVAFYPARMDACWVDGERGRPQQGSFYGGWITGRITGPFKGTPRSHRWQASSPAPLLTSLGATEGRARTTEHSTDQDSTGSVVG